MQAIRTSLLISLLYPQKVQSKKWGRAVGQSEYVQEIPEPGEVSQHIPGPEQGGKEEEDPGGSHGSSSPEIRNEIIRVNPSFFNPLWFPLYMFVIIRFSNFLHVNCCIS